MRLNQFFTLHSLLFCMFWCECVCLDVHDDDKDDDGDGMMVNCKRRFLLQKLVFTRVKKSSSLLNSCRFFIITHITKSTTPQAS